MTIIDWSSYRLFKVYQGPHLYTSSPPKLSQIHSFRYHLYMCIDYSQMYFLAQASPLSSWLVLYGTPIRRSQVYLKLNFSKPSLTSSPICDPVLCQQMVPLYKLKTMSPFCTVHIILVIFHICQSYLPNSSLVHLFGGIILHTTSACARTSAVAS